MRKTIELIVIALMLATSSAAWSQEKAPTTHALILSTQTMEAESPYARNMRDWIDRFVKLLTGKAGVPVENVRLLAATADEKSRPAASECTLENVKAAFAALGKTMTGADQFVLVIIGYGTVTDPVAKLCLPGPDLKTTTLAEMLDALPTRRIVIINCAGGGAEFLEKYARPGRVIVSACGKTGQGGRSYFAEFFLAAYESGKADADGDGKTTLLEAFNRSAHECINWYHRQYKIPPPKDAPPGPRKVEVRTEEARRLFKKFYEGIPDLEMVVPEQDEDPSVDPKSEDLEDLPLRREAVEHASLEDRGETFGALHWSENKHRPLTGKPGEEGELAARTVLGSPQLLSARP